LSLTAFVILALASVRARQAGRLVEEPAPDPDWTARVEAVEPAPAPAPAPLLDSLDETQLDMAPSWRRQARERWRADDVALGHDDFDDVLEPELEAEEEAADAEVPAEPVLPAEPLVLEATVIERRDWRSAPERYGFDEEDDDEEPALASSAIDDLFADDDGYAGLDVPEYEDAAQGELDPIEDYDDLTAAEIVPQLHDLELVDLQWVEQRERTGAKRTTVLARVQQLIVDAGGRATPSRSTKRATATKTMAKKTGTKKKAPAKKSAAKKGASRQKAATSRQKAAPARSASKTRRG
jgi:hypothetical protein